MSHLEENLTCPISFGLNKILANKIFGLFYCNLYFCLIGMRLIKLVILSFANKYNFLNILFV